MPHDQKKCTVLEEDFEVKKKCIANQWEFICKTVFSVCINLVSILFQHCVKNKVMLGH